MSAHAPQGPTGEGIDWSARPVDELIDYIVDRYHSGLRRDLSLLRELAETVRATELAQRPSLVAPLLEKLEILGEELGQHMVKEERLAFQMIRAAGGFVGVPLSVMEHEHRLAHDLLDELRALTGRWAAPVGASDALRRLYETMARVESELAVHSALEEQLFARARQAARP